MSTEPTASTVRAGHPGPQAQGALDAEAALITTSFGWRVLPSVVGGSTAVASAGLRLLRLPFDSARAQYAQGVQAGLIQRSMLASRDFECALHAMEQLALGPLARRV